MRVVAVEPLSGGVNSSVFELRLDDGSSLVLKLYRELVELELRKEPYVYGLAQGLGLPLATILYVDESKEMLPRCFAVLTKLDGRLLNDVQPELGDDELELVYREIGALLRRLHSVRFDAYGYLGVGEIVEPRTTNSEYMSSQFEKRLQQFGELGGNARLQQRISAHVRERAGLFAGDEGPCLCHNDCHEANLLVTHEDGGWRITGVVDFGNAVATDPLLDLAKTSAYSRWPSERRRDALADGHGDLRDDWREAILLYELYHRLELWWWFASTGTQLDLLPRIEAAIALQVGV